MANSIDMEVVERLSNSYVEYIEQVNNVIITMFNDLAEINTQERYTPLYQASRDFEQTYNENVKEKLTLNVRDWIESDKSFLSSVKKLKLGEYDENAATTAQNIILEAFEEKLQPSSVIADHPAPEHNVVKPDALSDKLEELFDNLNSSIESCVEENSAIVRAESEENMAIENFLNIDNMISTGIKVFAQTALSTFKECISEELKTRFEASEAMIEQTRSEADISANQILDDALNKLTSDIESQFDD